MKKIKKRLLVILTIVIFLLLVWLFSTFTLRTTYTEIRDSKIKNEITIVHLSDLHGMSFGNNNKFLIEKVRETEPDIIVVTGDMYTYGDSLGKETAVSLMKNLADDYLVYFVNGEHDNDSKYMSELSEKGIKVLSYREDMITVGETVLHLYGISNVYYTGTFNLSNAFERDDNNFTILLAHMQNFEKFAAFGIDISLCGDTHGGIFRLPFIGSVYDGDNWFPELNGEYIKGLYTLGNSKMYISSGLGNYPVYFRFCNRPEISVIKLLPEN